MSEITRGRRFCAALMAFCYLWLGFVVSLQHTHGEDNVTLPRFAAVASAATSRISSASDSHLKARKIHSATHCIACDWQAENVSPALNAMLWNFTPAFGQRAITTFPRYLRVASFPSLSRGPPAV